MVLVIAVFIGLIAGLFRSWVGRREYRFYELKAPLLVLVAFLPQIITFFLPSTKNVVPDKYAPIVLVSTQAILLLFAVLNIKKISFWPISLGFLANFVVIVLNGGLMPISPETIRSLVPNAPAEWLVTGQRLGTGKDIVLNTKDTILPILSDRFVTPAWLNYPVAFSLGDILISIGVMVLLWSMGGPQTQKGTE
ncbi:MAG: DUF5317 domain-containing protein [Anaerolineaceae bacterium]|nr:DUF5317 domain-containing protein [Anaerolineaceae bacterium]